MRKKIDIPNIPIVKNAVIAINLDRKKKKEHIIIGGFDNVNRYIHGGKKEKIIFDKTRPIGSFLLDIFPKASYFSDLKYLLADTSKQNWTEVIQEIEDLYSTENPILKFLALKLWEERNRILKALKDKDEYYPIIDRLDDMTLPYRHNLMNDILEWQRTRPFNPLADIPYEYFKYPILTFCVADTNNTTEYAAADFSIMPLIVYYLKAIYENKKYFSYCKVCGKLFLAPDVNKTVICSAKCRKEQQKKNKQKYEEETKDVDYEKTFRNENMYWYNRVQKAKKKCTDKKALDKLIQKYDEHKRIAVIKKKQVKNGLLSYQAFDMWCLDERIVIDVLMEDIGLGKYK